MIPTLTLTSCQFFARGRPIAQGSMKAVGIKNGRSILTTTAKGLHAWRDIVAWEARRAWTDPPLAGPVSVHLNFIMPKPKSAPKRRRTLPAKRPDLDKLYRACLDALSGVLYADDAQVVILNGSKVYVEEGGSVGVGVTVGRIEP